MSADLDVEVELLVRCADPTLDTPDGRIQSLVDADPDWERVVELARSHGVTPSVTATLTDCDEDDVPEATLSALRESARPTALRNVRLTDELHGIADRFESEGIRWLSFKGPVLAAAAYGDVSRRTFKDIDLLVHPADVSEAVDVLEAEGYERLLNVPRLDDAVVAGGPFTKSLIPEYTLCRDDVEVEVRCSVGDPDRPFTPAFETLWSRRTTVAVGGSDVPALSPADRLLVLAFHGTKHQWHLLKWVCDFAAAVAATAVDWSRLWDRASRHGAERKLLVGAALVETLFDLDVPRGGGARRRSDDRAGELAREVIDGFGAGPPNRPSKPERTAFNVRASDTLREGLTMLLSYRPFRPGLHEYYLLPVPGVFHPLYFLGVPVRVPLVVGAGLLQTLGE